MSAALRLRLWVLASLLLLLPFAVYWPTTWAEYGLRDDYALMREAREEPGTVLWVNGSHARPLYGLALKTVFHRFDRFADLSVSRLIGSACLGIMAAATCVILVRLQGWSLTAAASVGALFALVPSAQLVAGWSILWPYELSALLSMAAFVVAELGLRNEAAGAPRKAAHCLGAACLIVCSVYLFQPNGLFYLVFVAVNMVRPGELSQPVSRRRVLEHLLLLAASMLLAYILIRLCFEFGWVPVSKRVAFEQDYLGKLAWYIRSALPNGLAFLVLNDFQGRTAPWYGLSIAATLTLLLTGAVWIGRTRGWREAALWLLSLAGLLIGGYGVNLIAAERWASYRTIYPVVGVLVIYGVVALEQWGTVLRSGKWTKGLLAVAVVGSAAFFARAQAYELIAVPQHRELELVRREAQKLDITKDQSVYVITPTPEIATARLLYGDEFGSLSTDSDWVPKEVLKQVFHEQYPAGLRCTSLEHMVSGENPPPAGRYDVVIDLRDTVRR